MKKTLSLITLVIALSGLYAQDCMYPFISEYVEGTGNNKGVEIYNPTASPIDLSNYLIVRYSNGGTSPSAGYKTTLVGTLQPYSAFVLINGQTTSTETSPACDTAMQALADQLDGEYPAPTYMNGNDAITLESQDGIIWDIFGKVGEDPGTGWCDVDTLNYVTGTTYWWLAWSKDHTLIRKPTVKHGVFQNPGSVGAPEYFMVQVEWDTVPGYWSEADTAWVSANIWDNLGSHECECDPSYNSVPSFQTRENSLYLFPNPAAGQEVLVKGTAIIKEVELLNALGQRILFLQNPVQRGDMTLKFDENLSGIHFVKVRFADGSIATQKLMIQ